ncbi:MAG: lamin tail domain-containing protein [Candidatus Paceibacterota bacterium]
MPKIILAIDFSIFQSKEYQTFSEIETKNILHIFIQHISDDWEKLRVTGSFDAKETTALSIVREAIRFDLWNYIFGDLPADVTVAISTELYNVAKILKSENPISSIVSRIEKETVKKAIETANDYLFQNQMKASFGAMKVKYRTGKAEVDSPFQYILVYKPINKDSGDLIVRIYSPKEIDPPVSHGSIGMAVGFLNDLPEGQKLPPFIAEIRGKIAKTNFPFDYKWIGDPTIKVFFPQTVPDFGLRPKSWEEKYIIEPIVQRIKDISNVISTFFPPAAEVVEYIPYENGNQEMIDSEIQKIANNNYLSATTSIFEINTQKPKSETVSENVNQPEQKTQTIIDLSAIGQTNNNIIDQTIEEKKTKEKSEKEEKKIEPEEETVEPDNDLSNGFSEKEKIDGLLKALEELKKRNGTEEIIVDESEEETQEKPICQLPVSTFSKQNRVLINEIAWMGSKKNSAHEWIELRSISPQDVSLDNWSLVSADKKLNIVFNADHTVLTGGFLLLEKTTDAAVPNIKADIIYEGTLNNTGESLYLFNSDCELEDVIIADSGWPGGDNTTKRTLGRNLIDSGWHTYGGEEAAIMGTPKKPNDDSWWYKKSTTKKETGGGSSTGTVNNGSNNGTNNGNEEDDEEDNGSITYCSQSNLSNQLLSPIIINEVGWMGTATNYADEWIELKNISSETVNLNGWQLLDKDNQIKIAFKNSDTIVANGFYLLERTDDSSVPNLSANKIYSGALSDSDESLRLFNANCQLVDEVITSGSGWLAGESTNKKSMERKIDLSGWQTYADPSVDSVTGLWATPKRENSSTLAGNEEQNQSEGIGEGEESGNTEDEDNEDEEDEEEEEPVVAAITTEGVQDLEAITVDGQKNAALLSWSPLDQAADYEVYFSLNETLDANNLKNITEYEPIELVEEDGKIKVEIKDLYYDSVYHFAARGKDGENNYSLISNIVDFSISGAIHERSLVWGDAGHTGKSDFDGPLSEEMINAEIFVSGPTEQFGYNEFYLPPIIDENGAIIFEAKIDNKQGIYSFDKEGQQKWFFESQASYAPLILSADGTLYNTNSGSVVAVKPNGQLKWKEDLSPIIVQNPGISSSGDVYIISSQSGSATLIKIKDNKDGTITKETIYDFSDSPGADPISSHSEIIFDNDDNLYVSINNILFVFDSAGQKISERSFGVVFANDYEKKGGEEEAAKIGEIIAENDVIFVNVISGNCLNGDNRCRNMLYAFNVSDLNGEPLWQTNINYGNLAGAGDDEIYYIDKGSGDYGWAWNNLVALKLGDGSQTWIKRNSGQGITPDDISLISIDAQNNIYLSRGSAVYGFDPELITDEQWESGQIFSVYGIWSENLYPVVLGRNAMYLHTGFKIAKVSY